MKKDVLNPLDLAVKSLGQHSNRLSAFDQVAAMAQGLTKQSLSPHMFLATDPARTFDSNLRSRGLFGPDFAESISRVHQSVAPHRMGIEQLIASIEQVHAPLTPMLQLANSLRGIRENVGRAYAPTVTAAFNSMIPRIALPSLSILDQMVRPNVAVLAGTPNLESGLLTWVEDEPNEEDRHASHAAVSTLKPVVEQIEKITRLEIVTEVEVQCAVCERPMLEIDHRLFCLSPTSLRMIVMVMPMCDKCLTGIDTAGRRAGVEIEPTLTLIPGDQEGDGKPSGRLRLVKPEGKEDE